MSSTPPEEPKRKPRRRNNRGFDEAVRSITQPIANWQATFAWRCTEWGLIPFVGLPLGLIGIVFGALGYRRFRRRPEDLGIRHAVGALILGPIEVAVNLAGIACIVKGVLQLTE
jgi:hypothetical protein